MRRWNAFLVASPVCLAVIPGCSFWGPAVWRTEENHLTLPAQSLDRLRVETDNGAISLRGSPDVHEIVVHATRKGGGASETDAEACLNAIEIETVVEGTTQKLGWRWREARRRGWSAEVSFEVELPLALEVSAESHNGAIDLAGLASAGVVRTHNGKISVQGHQGPLELETHNGKIVVRDHQGPLQASTHNGAIEFTGVAPKLRLVSSNGAIDSDLSGTEAVDGEVQTQNGAVLLTLGDDASARLECETQNGAIEVSREMEIERKKRGVLLGKVGGGSGSLKVTTKNGSITVH